MSSFEDEYLGVLMSIEHMIVPIYHEYDEMTDWETLNAINGLIRTYTAEMRHRKTPQLQFDTLEEEVYVRVNAVCEFHLGRESFTDKDGNPVNIQVDPVSVSEMVQCLKRIRKSIQLWQKEGGKRGYFNYVSQFLPPLE